MRIARITLKNIRKFAEHTQEFGPGWNECVRENEWGKTTLADSIRYALCDEKIRPGDVTSGSPNEPSVVLEMEGAAGTVAFEARGTGFKPKQARERIARHLGSDYNYLVNSLLVVKHREIEEFRVEKNYIESMMKLENIADYTKRLQDLFVRSGDFSKSALGPHAALTGSIVALEKDILDMEDSLARGKDAEAGLERLRKEYRELEARSAGLKSEEDALALFLARAERDELDAKRSQLGDRIRNAENAIAEAKGEIVKIDGALASLRASIESGARGDLNDLYKKRASIERQIKEDESLLRDVSSLNADRAALAGKAKGPGPARLKKDRADWDRARSRVESGGRIGLRADARNSAAVTVNGAAVPSGVDMEYTDRLSIGAGPDVSLEIWAGGKSIAKDIDLMKKMSGAYGSMEGLDDLIEAHGKLADIDRRLAGLLKGTAEKDVGVRRDAAAAELKSLEQSIAAAEKASGLQKKHNDELIAHEARKAELKGRISGEEKIIGELRADLAGIAAPDENAARDFAERLNGLPFGVVEKYRGMDSRGLRSDLDTVRGDKEAALTSMLRIKDAAQDLKKASSDVSGDEIEKKREQLRALVERKKSMDAYLGVIRGLNAVFPALQKSLHGHVVGEIQAKALEYFRKITGGSFSDFVMGADKKGDPRYTLKDIDGRELAGTESLSDGTRDQLFFALRFAMISQFSGGEPKFMVLDEPFAHTDPAREKRMRDILDVFVNEGWQIIVFACRS